MAGTVGEERWSTGRGGGQLTDASTAARPASGWSSTATLVLWVTLLLMAVLAAGATTVEAIHDPLGECVTRSADLPGEIAYAGVVDSELGWFPLGATCTYDAGGSTFVRGPGWSRTLFVTLAPLAALVGLVLAVRRVSLVGRR